uniref:Uncharacterized protein n=1 Tax=viral metagenome TaxID=1070528 RepID=A0A6M3Y4D3_9ZZZZ
MKKCPECGCEDFILAGDAYDFVEYVVTIKDDGAVVTVESWDEMVEYTTWHADIKCYKCGAHYNRESLKELLCEGALLPFTVLLLYPDYIAENYGTETYLDQVYARTAVGAIDQAQNHAMEANDIWDDESGADPCDFCPLLTLRGHWNDLTPVELQVFGDVVAGNRV